MIEKTRNWIKKNRKDFAVLLLILVLGAFVRLYKIEGFMTFLGDEGRDAIIVRRLLVNFDPILIGPGTSIGNMYLGPLYYYMMAPFLLLFNFSPVGPAVMVALLGVVTIFLVWYTAGLWFGKRAAIVSALLYALSPVVIVYSRSSWNPNIMPFFSLLTVLSLWKVWVEEKYVWLTFVGIFFAFILQSHYLGLLLFPTIIVFWLMKYRDQKRKRESGVNSFWRNTIFGVLVFAFLMSPLLIFDLRHNWMNFKAMKTFFTERQTTVSIKPWKSIPNLYPIVKDNVSIRIVAGKNINVGKISSDVLIVSFVAILLLVAFKLKRTVNENNVKVISDKGFLMLVVWIGFGLLGLGLYKQHLYDHYFGFLYPAIYLFIGGMYQKITDLHFDGAKIIVTGWIILLVGSYIVNTPIRSVPNYQMFRAQEVAESIKRDAGDSIFNLAVIAQQNYEDGYQYFLEKDGMSVVDIDPQKLKETTGKYLYVICEMSRESCDPTHSPKAEIANFGWSRIDNEWGVLGVTVFKLAHVN